MKWVWVIQEKVKISLALAVISAVILLINLSMESQVSQLDAFFKTIYHDRLVAGKDISSIIEILYENRLLLEEHIHAEKPEQHASLENRMVQNQAEADSLIKQFKKTVLVREETKALKAYEHHAQSYRDFQRKLLALSHSDNKRAAYQQYLQYGNTLFQQTLQPAHELAAIQTNVGKELYQASQDHVQTTRLLSSLEAAVVIIIGVIILALLQASTLLFPPSQKYRLN